MCLPRLCSPSWYFTRQATVAEGVMQLRATICTYDKRVLGGLNGYANVHVGILEGSACYCPVRYVQKQKQLVVSSGASSCGPTPRRAGPGVYNATHMSTLPIFHGSHTKAVHLVTGTAR